MATLHIHTEEELYDLTTWAKDHPADDYTQEQRDALCAWFATFYRGPWESGPNRGGTRQPVPAELVEILDALIEDWGDVLASHDEEFHTTLNRGA